MNVVLSQVFIHFVLLCFVCSRQMGLFKAFSASLKWFNPAALGRGAYLYIVRAIHHNCPVLLIVNIWSRLPQLFGLVPRPLPRLCIWELEGREGLS